MYLSKLCEEIKPSDIRKMFNKALGYKNPIDFTIGEPDFTASQNIVEAGCKAIMEGRSKYSPNAGIPRLREAISEYLKKSSGLEYKAEGQIIVTPGAMGALYLGLKTLLNPGDEVIISDPSWTNYAQQIIMNGGKPVPVPAKEESGFNFNLQDLENAVTEKTKAIIVNSPCNPTGAELSQEILVGISEIAKKKDLFVISDEVYKQIRYNDSRYKSISEISGMKDRTIVVDSFSKTYAMTGWRIGFAAGPEEIIRNMVKFQEDVAACAAMPCQYAALEALKGNQEHLAFMVSEYKKRRDYLCEEINKTTDISCKIPSATFYLFINIKNTGLVSEEFAMRLLEEKQVVVVPGTAFGTNGEGYIRISYAASMEDIAEGMKRIREFVESIK